MDRETTPTTKGLSFARKYTRDDVSVFEQFEYDYRTSVIRNPSGEVVFEMNNVEVPKGWSQIATDILAQKYFRKAGVPQPDGSVGRETSVKQVAHRMANCWRVWGERYGYFAGKRCFADGRDQRRDSCGAEADGVVKKVKSQNQKAGRTQKAKSQN